MDLRIKEIRGIRVSHRKSVALVPWKEEVAYVACVGSGAVLLPLNTNFKTTSDCDRQIFYNQPPAGAGANEGQSPTNSSFQPTTNSESHSSSNPFAGPKLVRVNRSSCLDASALTNLVAIGEQCGYFPRLLLYDLVSGTCLDSIRDQYQFGVNLVKFSPSGKLLASLGTPQDGYIHIWKVENGSFQLHSSNRCTSEVNDLVWINEDQVLTVGVRFIKVWNVDSGSILYGRNIILGSLIDHTFECALPILENDKTSFLVGSSRGGVYKMPENEVYTSVPTRPVKSIALATIDGKPTVIVSTSNRIYSFEHETTNFDKIEPSEIFTYGSPAVLSLGSSVYYLSTSEESSELLKLPLKQGDLASTPEFSETGSLLRKRGLNMRARGKVNPQILIWNSDDNKVLSWPSTLHFVPFSDITIADICEPAENLVGNEQDMIAGSLRGDVWLGKHCYNAHNGPITDVHMLNSTLCISSGRDRTVQVWARHKLWYLKQTILFSTPILKAQLCTNDANHVALVCCGANKTVYVYTSSGEVNTEDANSPVFSDSPRSFLLKGMPFDMAAFGEILAVSTNDKTVSVLDPWAGDTKIRASWRPIDGNGDSVNLTHIQIVQPEASKLQLVGAATNKSVLVFDLWQGDTLGQQWGHGEPVSGIACSSNLILSSSDTLIISQASKCEKNLLPAAQAADSAACRGSVAGSGNSLPKLMLPNQSPPASRPTSPMRRVFASTGSPTSRSVSPVRSPLRSHASPTRSPSPPPRLHARSPVLERGRSAGTAINTNPNHVTMAQIKQPNLAYKPLKLSESATAATTTKSMPVTKDAAVTAPAQPTQGEQELISSLKSFLAQPASGSPSSATGELKTLLMSALNQVDGLALLDEYTQRLSSQIGQRLETQIAQSLRQMQASRENVKH